MRWPWQRRPDDGGPRPVAAAAPAGWAFVPPLQRVVAGIDPLTRPDTFPRTLTAWGTPGFLGPMTHAVDDRAPGGVLDGDGRGAVTGLPTATGGPRPSPELTLLLPPPLPSARAVEGGPARSLPVQRSRSALVRAPEVIRGLPLRTPPVVAAREAATTSRETAGSGAGEAVPAGRAIASPLAEATPAPGATPASDAPTPGVAVQREPLVAPSRVADLATRVDGGTELPIVSRPAPVSAALPVQRSAPTAVPATAAPVALQGVAPRPGTAPDGARRLGIGAPLPSDGDRAPGASHGAPATMHPRDGVVSRSPVGGSSAHVPSRAVPAAPRTGPMSLPSSTRAAAPEASRAEPPGAGLPIAASPIADVAPAASNPAVVQREVALPSVTGVKPPAVSMPQAAPRGTAAVGAPAAPSSLPATSPTQPAATAAQRMVGRDATVARPPAAPPTRKPPVPVKPAPVEPDPVEPAPATPTPATSPPVTDVTLTPVAVAREVTPPVPVAREVAVAPRPALAAPLPLSPARPERQSLAPDTASTIREDLPSARVASPGAISEPSPSAGPVAQRTLGLAAPLPTIGSVAAASAPAGAGAGRAHSAAVHGADPASGTVPVTGSLPLSAPHAPTPGASEPPAAMQREAVAGARPLVGATPVMEAAPVLAMTPVLGPAPTVDAAPSLGQTPAPATESRPLAATPLPRGEVVVARAALPAPGSPSAPTSPLPPPNLQLAALTSQPAATTSPSSAVAPAAQPTSGRSVQRTERPAAAVPAVWRSATTPLALPTLAPACPPAGALALMSAAPAAPAPAKASSLQGSVGLLTRTSLAQTTDPQPAAHPEAPAVHVARAWTGAATPSAAPARAVIGARRRPEAVPPIPTLDTPPTAAPEATSLAVPRPTPATASPLALAPAPVPTTAPAPVPTTAPAPQTAAPEAPPSALTIPVTQAPTTATATAQPPKSGDPFAALTPVQLEDLARRLTDPLLRRLRAETLRDRDRLGLRTDLGRER